MIISYLPHGVSIGCFLVSIKKQLRTSFLFIMIVFKKKRRLCFPFIPINISNKASLVFLFYIWWRVNTIKRRHLEVRRPMQIFSKGLWLGFLNPDLHLPWTLLLILGQRFLFPKEREKIISAFLIKQFLFLRNTWEFRVSRNEQKFEFIFHIYVP